MCSLSTTYDDGGSGSYDTWWIVIILFAMANGQRWLKELREAQAKSLSACLLARRQIVSSSHLSKLLKSLMKAKVVA
eukprot:scaffold28512_cov100-Skeletonema_dohrnii-CCMP3373.AAC.1